MAGNSFGEIFRITTFGESHGPVMGVVIDGCPAGIKIDEGFIQTELDRRKPGQSKITTQRKEADLVEVVSGVFDGRSTGTPLTLVVKNQDQKSKDYSHIADKFRPSHADYTYQAKYGRRDYRGGGRSSARETLNWVAAGAIAKTILRKHGVEIIAYVSQVGKVKAEVHQDEVTPDLVEKNIVRCPDPQAAEEMEKLIKTVRKQGDTLGGKISCVIRNCPAGLGEPVFSKLHADLGKAMLGINAVKGFEYGSGFKAVEMHGSEHNDAFEKSGAEVITQSNHSGGIQGGISNGMPIYFNVAFKPVATLMSDQQSINEKGEKVTVKGKGRHDPCVVPRAVPIVEALAALVLIDHLLRHQLYQQTEG